MEISFVPCESVVSEKAIVHSGVAFSEGVASGEIQCIRPEDVSVS